MEKTRSGLQKNISVIFEGMSMASVSSDWVDAAKGPRTPASRLRDQIEQVIDRITACADDHARLSRR